jgi:methylmalonyl-CoA decarboxylase
MSLIVFTTQGDIGFITLNHERKKNALSEPLIREITVALSSFREQRIRVVILRAHPGTTVWSAGHDVTELPEFEDVRVEERPFACSAHAIQSQRVSSPRHLARRYRDGHIVLHCFHDH